MTTLAPSRHWLAIAAAALSAAGCGSSTTSSAPDASADAGTHAFTSCNGPAPAGYVPPKLPGYSGATCPMLALTPSGVDAGFTPPENDIATRVNGATNMRQFKLLTPSAP